MATSSGLLFAASWGSSLSAIHAVPVFSRAEQLTVRKSVKQRQHVQWYSSGVSVPLGYKFVVRSDNLTITVSLLCYNSHLCVWVSEWGYVCVCVCVCVCVNLSCRLSAFSSSKWLPSVEQCCVLNAERSVGERGRLQITAFCYVRW